MTRVERLGLSTEDFKHFLIDTGRISEMDTRTSPAKISQLMSDDKLWQEYEVMAEKRAAARESGSLQNGGTKHASTEERKHHVQ